MSSLGRPGKGGRKPRRPAGSETSAMAEVRKQLGESVIRSHKGARVEIWELDETGTTVIGARLSSEDIGKGQNIMGQIKGGFDLCGDLGLKVRYVVAATRMSGDRPQADRMDLEFIRKWIHAGHIDTVVYREVDRMGRRSGVRDEFWRFLEETGTELYFSTKGRPTDWDEDGLTLAVEGGMADHERRKIVRRTGGGIRQNLLDVGWGWPGCVRFGFKRIDGNAIVVDPKQWKFVQMAFESYAKVGPTGRGSISRLRTHMVKQGCRISEEGLRKMLRDEIYVTGKWGVTVLDEYYEGNRIEIPNPISAELQARNIALLESTKGRNSITPFGTYLLNTIPVYHGRCMQIEVERKQPRSGKIKRVTPQLRGRGYGDDRRADRPPTYSHYPKTPKCCSRYSVPAELLERTVVDSLLSLAESRELQLAYIQKASEDDSWDIQIEDPQALDREIQALTRGRREIVSDFNEEIRGGDTSAKFRVAKLLDGIDEDIAALTRRKEIALSSRPGPEERDSKSLRADLRRCLTAGPGDPDHLRQKKVALIEALVSKVVVHDSDQGGYEVEIFGHLIPPGSRIVPEEISGHFENALDEIHKPATKSKLSGRFVTGCGEQTNHTPAWRSERVFVREVPYEYTLDSVKKSIRFAHEKLPPGRMFGRGSSPYERLRIEHPGLLRTAQIAIVCRKRGTTRDQVIRSAIDVEPGLREGRFGPRSVEEVRTTIRWALEDGMTLDPGWAMRWDSFARKLPYLETYSWLGQILRENGTSLKRVAFEIKAKRRVGQPRIVSGVPAGDPPKTDRAILVHALSSEELVPFGYDRGKLILLRQKRRLFRLKIEKDQNFYYPKWQFSTEMGPRSIVPEILAILGALGLDEWDLEGVMSESSEFGGKTRSLRELVDEEASAEWLIAQIKYRLEVRRRNKLDGS